MERDNWLLLILAWTALFMGIAVGAGKYTGEKIWFIVALGVPGLSLLMYLGARERENEQHVDG